jgi:Flp pilus assembly protein TadD
MIRLLKNTSLSAIAGMSLFMCISFDGHAQSLDQARKLYHEGRYGDAKPAFEKLVGQSPNNSSYNLWYGVCCYETGDAAGAEIYLSVARKRKVAEASRYLAIICTEQYRFDEAVDMWQDYIEQMTKKKEDTEDSEQQMEYAGKLMRMKEKTEDVQVIDSMVIDKDRMLSVYFLSEDCGTVESFQTHFQSAEPTPSTVYVNPKGNQACYARPDSDGRFALYTHVRLTDAWTDEKAVFPADTSENNYPFVLGDGRTLYFASKGNGSIGGYDLFVTRYNLGSNAYLAPEQLGMPFNSPANDYWMIIDEVKGVGWFASDRNQPEGKVCLYLFIPSDSRRWLENGTDDAYLRQRAMLASIRDTWAAGQDYTRLIQLAQTGAPSAGAEVHKDFEFAVNDRTVYYMWSDFRNAEARSFYEKAVALKKQQASVAGKLAEARDLYTAGNAAARSRLSPTILQAEKEQETLARQVKEWEKKARNRENVQLKNK